MNYAMNNAKTGGHKLAVVLLDLDNFKLINDHYGHALGDQLLVQVAKRLQYALNENDMVARLGGDEFVLLLDHLSSIHESIERLENIKQQLIEPFWIQGISLTVNASMGATTFPDDLGDSDTLLRHVDQAMYTAKQLGRNRIYHYDLLREEALSNRYQQLLRLHIALENNEFELYYQPKVNLLHKSMVGVEALIRWNHPEKGLVLPGEFLPIIADDPFMLDLGHWVMTTALKQITHWNQQNLMTKVSINIPAQQLLHDNFISDVESTLNQYPIVAPHQLEMEILETDALKDVEKVQSVILELQKKGIRFSLDDFGTGYSSLAYMKHLPVDILKIDRSFIVDMLEDEQELAIVQGIIGMAKVFRKDLIAEGIENESQSAALIALGCDNGQGFWIGRPMPADKIPVWVRTD
jgi:diguanylate cyclase (GGDEF)-like protein